MSSFENPYYFFCIIQVCFRKAFAACILAFAEGVVLCGAFAAAFAAIRFRLGNSIGILYNKVIDLYKLSDISVLRVVKTEQISFRQHPGTRSCSSTVQVLLLSSEEEENLLKLFAGARYLSRIFSTFAVLSRGFHAAFAENSSGLFDFPLKHLLFSAAAAGWSAAAGWLACCGCLHKNMVTHINNEQHDMRKKFGFRESFRDAVLWGSFAGLSRTFRDLLFGFRERM